MSFTIFLDQKTPFQAIRERRPKSRKIEIFPNFFFQALYTRKMTFTIFQNEKMPFQDIKRGSSKTRKIDIFFQGVNPWFWSKSVHFSNFFFFKEIQTRKMSFTIFQNEKAPFYAIKSKSSKTRNINIFPKGLPHGFGPKMAIFLTFFLKAIKTRKKSLTIFQNEKTSFYAIKTKSPKSRKTGIFSEGLTHGFGRKMAIFSTFSS